MQKRAVLKEQTEITNSTILSKMNDSDRVKEKQAIKNKVDEVSNTQARVRYNNGPVDTSDIDKESNATRFTTGDSNVLETQILLKHLEAISQTEKNKNVKKKDQKFLISIVDHAKYRLYWDYTIIITALYSCFVIPIKIGVNKYILAEAYDYIDAFTYILYFLDLLINFRTTFINT